MTHAGQPAPKRRQMQMGNRAEQLIGAVLILIVAAYAAAEASQADVADLLQKLNVTAYRRGVTPPDFTGWTADGRTASLASLRGKVVVLNFWASWCLECRPEMPLFERLHREFAAQGLSVIGINARESTATIRAYAKELSLTFPLVLDLKGEINAGYGVIGLPTTFLVGRDARAVGLAVGPREWNGKPARAVIQTLLAEPTLKET